MSRPQSFALPIEAATAATRLAETERQATRLFQLGQKPFGRDPGRLRLRRLELANARLHLSMP